MRSQLTFRVAYYAPEVGFTFNQYLVRDEEPLLYHTGFKKTFDETTPRATPIAGPVGAIVILDDCADRPARILQDDETLTTGQKRSVAEAPLGLGIAGKRQANRSVCKRKRKVVWVPRRRLGDDLGVVQDELAVEYIVRYGVDVARNSADRGEPEQDRVLQSSTSGRRRQRRWRGCLGEEPTGQAQMEHVTESILSNPSLVFFVLGFIAAAIALIAGPKPVTTARVADAVFAYFLLFSIGFGYLANFVFHSFFGEMTARFIGWADSPFQLEIAFASLGFAAVGFLAFRGSFDLRLAAVVGSSTFLLGAAGGHLYQIMKAGNVALGNAGVIFYMDIILPIVGFLLLWLQHKHPGDRGAPAAEQRTGTAR